MRQIILVCVAVALLSVLATARPVIILDSLVDSTVRFEHKDRPDFLATTDDTLKITWPLEYAFCQSSGYTYDWAASDGYPVPTSAWIDDTGTFHYVGAREDTGRYGIQLFVSEGEVGDTAEFLIHHYHDFICGDCNHDGDITLGDLTWLISPLFIHLIPPAPPEAGNVDCQPGVTLGDLTAMIDHLYISLGPLCDCPKNSRHPSKSRSGWSVDWPLFSFPQSLGWSR